MSKQICELCHTGISWITRIEYGGKRWHKKCFCCSICATKLTVNTVVHRDDRLYCSHCSFATPVSLSTISSSRDNASDQKKIVRSQSETTDQSTSSALPPDSSYFNDKSSLRAAPVAATTCQPLPPHKITNSLSHDERDAAISPTPRASDVSYYTGEEPQPRSRDIQLTSFESYQRVPSNIKVVEGSICEQNVDVIVNSIGTHLDLQRGACAKAIAAAAGSQLQKELYSVASSSDVAPGCVYVTQGYDLPCKFVFHVICHAYDKQQAVQNMRSLLRRILTEADKISVQSIAIPPLGAGNLGYPVNLLARTIVMETSSYVTTQQGTSLKEIRLVVLPNETNLVKAFGQIMNQDESGSSMSNGVVRAETLRELARTQQADRQAVARKRLSKLTD